MTSILNTIENFSSKEEQTLVLFDADGVLYDAEYISHYAGYEILEETNGKLPITKQTLSERLIGVKVEDQPSAIMQYFDELGCLLTFPDNFIGKLTTRQKELFEELDLEPIEGVIELIQNLQSQGIEYAIASRSRRQPLVDKLRKTGLNEYFNENNSFYPAKRKADPDAWTNLSHYASEHGIDLDKTTIDKTADFMYAAMVMGYAPDKCIGIEDTSSGIISISNANMTPICFTGAPSTKIELATKGIPKNVKYYLTETMV